MPTRSLLKSVMAKRLHEQVDTEMADAQPAAMQEALNQPFHHPAKTLPLTSYIGPPLPLPSSRPPPPKPNHKTPRDRGPKPVPDPFFPSFPEPLCYHLGCHSLSPHTHAHNQHLLLPTAETLRKAYEDVEVREARQHLGKGLRAKPRYASATASCSTTNTHRPSQKMRDAAMVRHGLKVKGELPASKQLHTASPAVSSPLKAPGSRMTGALRRALPVLSKEPQRPRRKATSQLIAPKSDLAQPASGPQKPTSFFKPSRMKTRSQESPQGAGSWVRTLEDADQLHRVVSGIEVIDLTGDD